MSSDEEIVSESEEEESESNNDVRYSESKVNDNDASPPRKPSKKLKKGAKNDDSNEKSKDEQNNHENVEENSQENNDSSPRKPTQELKSSPDSRTKEAPKTAKNTQQPTTEMHEDHMRIFNVNECNEGFPTNYISTTKYNLVTFFPLCLLKQFARIANIYFLVIAIMACVPQISTFTPYTAIFPLVFVLLVSIFREGVEDFYRYRSDRASNSKKVQRLGSEGTFEEVSSKDLEVGDVVYVEGEDTFAADVILLKSSNEVNAFIQTSSLDGEKNLKKRFVPKGLEELTKPVSEKAYVLGGKCVTIPQDKDLKSFVGTIRIGTQIFPLSIQQLMLKDSKLKNTSWIIGAVVYTGKHTKVMMNSQKARIKISNLERKLNVLIVCLFFVQIIICFLLSMITLIYDKIQSDNQTSYLGSDYKTYHNLNFFSYFLLLSTLIPISLIVTLEVIKTVQCYFISQDASMYEVEADRGAKVSTTTINEELGQVTYVFSDKTGTLTQNIMEFKALAVAEEIYGSIGDTITRKPTKIELRKEVESNYDGVKLEKLLSNKPDKRDTPHEIKSSNGKTKFILKSDKHKVQEVLKLLSICHDCEAETAVVEGKKIMFYQGESPDEVTLVDFARSQGFEFLEANEARSIIKLYPRSGMNGSEKEITKEYKIHRKVLFDSERKRMSILFTDPDDGKIKLFIKGADSIIKERLSKKFIDDKVMDHIDNFLTRSSVIGLRTLLMAMRVIDDEEFRDIMQKIKDCENDVKNSEKRLASLFNEVERELVLIGSTCVEDKLQDNVTGTLQDLRNAGIRVWMLTGDKFETAKNIGYSCKLLTDEMILFEAQGAKGAEKVFNEDLVKNNQLLMEDLKKRAVIFDAEALTFLTKNPQSLKYFINVAKTCNSVILSRASPSQKADIVRMIKKDDPTNITLAIGDGANDVSMILEADIGVGIYGKEGVRAAQSADFAIHQFKYLWNLVLYHGRYNYIRNSELILYFFFKNIVFTVPQIYFAFISDFSAETVFDDWYISFYNMFFTAVPIIIRSVFETDIDHRVYKDEQKRDQLLSLTPQLYYVGRRGLIFTYLNYLYWIFCALMYSLLIFLVTYFVFAYSVMDRYGRNTDMWGFSMCMFFSVMIVVTIKLMSTGRLFNIINFIAIFLLSLSLYYGYSWISNYMNFSKTLLTSEELHESPIFYLTIFLCSGTVLVFELLVETIRVNLMGSPAELARKEINSGSGISVWFEEQFARLLKNKEIGFVKQDIKKEKWIVKKRERRMKKMEENIRKQEEEKSQQLSAKKAEAQKNKEENQENKNENETVKDRNQDKKGAKQNYKQNVINNSEDEDNEEEEDEDEAEESEEEEDNS